jgi:hypothetical protein
MLTILNHYAIIAMLIAANKRQNLNNMAIEPTIMIFTDKNEDNKKVDLTKYSMNSDQPHILEETNHECC